MIVSAVQLHLFCYIYLENKFIGMLIVLEATQLANSSVALPKEMLLSFLIVQFLTNYDVTNRKQNVELIYSSVRKWHKESQNKVNQD